MRRSSQPISRGAVVRSAQPRQLSTAAEIFKNCFRDGVADEGRADRAARAGLSADVSVPNIRHTADVSLRRRFKRTAASRRKPAATAAAATTIRQFHTDLLLTRIALVLLHLSVVLGLVLIGYRHFDNVKTGIAAAVLYLMIPYTAEFTGLLAACVARGAAGLGW